MPPQGASHLSQQDAPGAAYSPVSGGLYRARSPAVDSADRAARGESIARAKASSRARRALNLAKKKEEN